jgi:hypothetical protein
MQSIVDAVREKCPPIFPGQDLDRLTGGVIKWGTIQNKRSRREGPPEAAFFRVEGQRQVNIVRDIFFDWWGTTLTSGRCPLPPWHANRLKANGEAA